MKSSTIWSKMCWDTSIATKDTPPWFDWKLKSNISTPSPPGLLIVSENLNCLALCSRERTTLIRLKCINAFARDYSLVFCVATSVLWSSCRPWLHNPIVLAFRLHDASLELTWKPYGDEFTLFFLYLPFSREYYIIV